MIKTKDDFKSFVDEFYKTNKKPCMFGIARVHYSQDDSSVLSTTFLHLNVEENFGSFACFIDAFKKAGINIGQDNEIILDITPSFIENALCTYAPFLQEEFVDKNLHKNLHVLLELKKALEYNYLSKSNLPSFQLIGFYEDLKCQSIQCVYAKLYALSLGKKPLRSLNLDSIFGLLQNVAWCGLIPYSLKYLRENEIMLKATDSFPSIDYIDKFPRYLAKILPSEDNIRILDSANARFGAYLASGYTQMPGASYVNFNAGALGACMNEGRISSSVIVGKNTDIGGGASILGVLSGGNSEPISIGENCLLGANSVTGISLGDGCIVDAGISILAGSKVYIDPKQAQKIKEVNSSFCILESNIYKGSSLSGKNGIHFRVDSTNGRLNAFRSIKEIELNKNLH